MEQRMRKRYKIKARSCALCKPHKRGWERRWNAKDQQLIEGAERDMHAVRLVDARLGALELQ
jgi:hypothetical protein